MTTTNLGEWEVFDPSHQRKDKWQALKVLEEAAEVVEAAKHVVMSETIQTEQVVKLRQQATTRQCLANEIADLLQTIVNLCDAYDISEAALSKAQEWCNLKSTERGMFEPGPRTHMHREGDDE